MGSIYLLRERREGVGKGTGQRERGKREDRRKGHRERVEEEVEEEEEGQRPLGTMGCVGTSFKNTF